VWNSREKAQRAQKREEKIYHGDTEFGLKEKDLLASKTFGSVSSNLSGLCVSVVNFSSHFLRFLRLFAAIPLCVFA
jgi:hypothetical protein